MPKASCNTMCESACTPIQGCALNLMFLCQPAGLLGDPCIENKDGAPEGMAPESTDAAPETAKDKFVSFVLRDGHSFTAAARVFLARAIRKLNQTCAHALPMRRSAAAGGMDVANTFTYHKPFGNQAARYEEIRTVARGLALLIQDTSHASREQALALTKLQEVVMFANAAIAINEVE